MARNEAEGAFNRTAAIFAVAFVLAVAVLALLGQFGLSDAALEAILTAATLLTFVAVAFAARTLGTSAFFVAGRAVPPVANGMASAAAFISGAVFLGLPAAFFVDDHAAAALALGWSFGFLMMAVLFAPYVRKSGAYGVADFLAIRYGGRAVSLTASLIVAVALLAALAAAMAAASAVATILLGASPRAAVLSVVLLVLAAPLLGGMQAVTLTGIIQYIVLALAFLVPPVFVSAREFSLPIPQLTFGRAVEQATELVTAGVQDVTAVPAGDLLSFAPETAFGFFAALVVLAFGVASLPHLLIRSATVSNVAASRWSVGWSLVFMLAIALTAPAYAAFARLAILRAIAGSEVGGLPNRIGVDPDGLVLAWAEIVALPHVMSALIGVGALAATLAAAGALAFTIGSTLGHDLYGRLLGVRASAGRRLAVTRLFLIGVVALGGWLAANRGGEAVTLAPAAISLSAGGLFPALFLGIWWRRANAAGAVAGMLAGFAATTLMIAALRYPGLVPLGPFEPRRLGLSAWSAAIVGLPAGFIVIVFVSLVTAPPSRERRQLLDAIRRPGGQAFVREGEG